MSLRDETNVAKNWVEAHYPLVTGTHKAMLILTFGAGLDRGMAEAQETINDLRDELIGAGYEHRLA